MEDFIPQTPQSPASPPVRKKFLTVRRALHKLISYKWRVAYTLVVLLVGFFIGYQLAIYQTDNDKALLPHFTIGDSPEQMNCPTQPCFGADDCVSSMVCQGVDKPVIYLYPTQPAAVNVKLSYFAGFSKTDPVYNSKTGWQVLAQPDGTLTNRTDGKDYPYLFWEGNPAHLDFDMSQGFVVAGKDTKTFLQNQLLAMGLNQNETHAFIEYWLPRMAGNLYNQIHFAGSEYTKLAPLHITPQPESLLRVFMAYKPLHKPVEVSPQTFPTFERTGFTAVEWGGTELSTAVQ